MVHRFTACLITIITSLAAISVLADSPTLERLGQLPAAERKPWEEYLKQSTAKAQADEAALQREVVANKMTLPLKALSGGDFKLKYQAGDAWFAGDEAKQLADTILSFQTPSGGWSKHLGFSKGPRQPGMQWSSQNEPGKPAHYVATFDNASTTSELQLLAGVWLATKREDCKAGFIKGLQFIFAAQYPNGGWPQVYPLEGGYHDNITLNDDALTNILELLSGIVRQEPRYAFLEEPERKQAAAAYDKGIKCVLQMQYVQNGKRTAWCSQHDPLSLQPAAARKMEPAALSGLESANLLRFLMTLPDPSPEVVTCINAGLQWLDDAKIEGLAAATVNGKGSFVPDPTSKRIYWARFYDLQTGKPIFPGRDGIIYETFDAMAAKNELGYDFYSSRPESILNNGQKKWRKMLLNRLEK